jgi:hypothetical protein
VTLQKIIKAIAVVILIISAICINRQSTALYHNYQIPNIASSIRTHFDFFLIVNYLFLISFICAFAGGSYLYRLRKLGLILLNTMFLIHILILLIILFPNQYHSLIDFIFSPQSKSVNRLLVFGGFSLGKWYEFIIPTIYISTLIFINLRFVSKTLRK